MNLSFSTRGWPELAWDEMVDTALSMGFTGIEVYNLPKFGDMLAKGGPFHPYQTAATVRALREKKLAGNSGSIWRRILKIKSSFLL